MMGRLFKSKMFKAVLAVMLAVGLVPLQQFASGCRSVPAYAREDAPAGAIEPIPEYLEGNADASKIGTGALEATGFTLSLKQSYADTSTLPDESIEGFFAKRDVRGLMATLGVEEPVYESSDESEWFVALMGNERLNASGSLLDFVVTDGNDLAPENLTERCRYDSAKGLLYLPKSLFVDGAGKVVRDHVCAQTLVRARGSSLAEAMESDARVTVGIVNDSGTATAPAHTQVVPCETFDITTTVPIATPETAAELSLSDVEVHLNGNPQPFELDDRSGRATAFYDRQSGELTLLTSPATVSRIDVSIKGKPLGERLFGTPAAQATGKAIVDASELGVFKYAKKIKFAKGDLDTLKPGALYRFSGGIHRHYPSKKGQWEYDVRKKTRESVYVSCVPTGKGLGRRISNEETAFDWQDLKKAGGAHHIDEDHGFLDFFMKMPSGDGKIVNRDELSKKARATASGRLNFDKWTPVKTCKGGKKYFVGGCSHSSAALEVDSDSDCDEMFRVLAKKGGERGYIVFGVAATAKVGGQQGYAIIKVPAKKRPPRKGWCSVLKGTWNKWDSYDGAGYVSGNDSYGDLEDAEFGLYKTKSAAEKRSGEIDTWTAGAESEDVAPGTYWVAEVSAPKGYTRSSAVKRIVVREGEEAVVSFDDSPRYGPLRGKIVKVHQDDDGKWVPGEAGSLAGAEFTLTGPGDLGCVFVTDESGEIRFDSAHSKKAAGKLSLPMVDGAYVLPLGTWRMKETSAPPGYDVPAHGKDTITFKVEDDGTQTGTGATVTAATGENGGAVIGNLARRDGKVQFRNWKGRPGRPWIETQAAGPGDSSLDAEADNAVSDTIFYHGLTVGKSYSWSDELHARSFEGNDLGVLCHNGARIAGSGTFEAARADGEVPTWSFTLPADDGLYTVLASDGSASQVKLSEVSLVFFAGVSGGDLVEELSEADISEERQTLSFADAPPRPDPNPASGTFTVYKAVSGITSEEASARGMAFGFRVTDDSGAQIGNIQWCRAGESLTFRTPSYTARDAGAHTLWVSEVANSEPRWRYDASPRPVSVVVSVAGSVVSVSCTVGGRGATFVNSYTPSGGIRLRKIDDAWGPIAGVTFDLRGPTSTGVTTDQSGIADTGSEALAPGDYTVTERIPVGAVKVTESNCGGHPERIGWFKWKGRYLDPGWSRACKVVDGQTTDLTAEPVVNPLEDLRVSFGARKILKSSRDGSELPIADGQFAFEVYRDAGRKDPLFSDGDGRALRFPVDASGQVTFPSVEYDGERIGSIESFYVFEADLGNPDTTYDKTGKRVTVTTSFDEVAGEPRASVTYYGDDGAGEASPEPIAFEDWYTPKARFKVGKVAAGTGEALAGAEFSVRSTDSGAVVDTLVTGASGTADSMRLPLGDYEVRETKAPAGFECSTRVLHVRLSSDGQLVDLTGDPFVDGPATTGVQVCVMKTLDGRLAAPGEFSFELRDAGGNTISTARNDASGLVAFPKLSFTGVEGACSDVHLYTVHERRGGVSGVVYDETVAQVEIVVSKVDGGIRADVSYSKPRRYLIDFDLAGGRLASRPAGYVADGKTSVTLPNPERHGYEFLGWTGSNGGTPEVDLVIAAGDGGNKCYKANWKQNPKA